MTEARDLSNERCVVLGASGFIGRNLCRALRVHSSSIKAFSRESVQIDGVTWQYGDFLNDLDVDHAVAGAETVFHLVSTTVPASSNANPHSDAQQNILQTIRLLDACRDHGVKRVIFASSGGTVYGEVRETPIPETHPTLPISGYGISKLTCERYLHLYEKMHGIKGISLRIANPYGPFQESRKKQGVIGHFINSALMQQPVEIWGDGSVIRDYLYIDDVVEAMILAAGYDGAERVFNIGSGIGHSLNDIALLISEALGLDLEVVYKEFRSADVSKNVLDCSRAERELNWHSRHSIQVGIKKTVAWYRDKLVRAKASE
ncbi:NAD-dependent epimerase/dehydratase family protein [Rhizobium sp. BK538]|uniref:NAD-dependent epimerase/dehydratase family protein n=1 Tax=Rhizobium sp. BK538 TaxID=2586984 RepID=UPI0016128224|nr:NAD-dependent epimerase/dehydratase family protein [Rhizobium sp. BK538]MBB4167365.1 UDP-glucose 4-epimerase [Rhizobium sp. BK538]